MQNTRLVKFPGDVDYKKQSTPIPGSKLPGQTHEYRNAYFRHIDIQHPNTFKTLPGIFEEGLLLAQEGPCLGYRQIISKEPLTFADDYTWQTYAQIDVRRHAVGSAIQALFMNGVLTGENGFETVGIWATNRPEWQIINLATQIYGKVLVSLYDTLGPDSTEYIINHCHLPIIFTEASNVPVLLKQAPRLPTLKVIVSMDDLAADTKLALNLWSQERGIKFFVLHEIEAQGQKNPIDPSPVTPETVATISYTSGTTGTPKGVVLTHGNLATSVYAFFHGVDIPDDTKAISYSFLPLAHIYEMVIELVIIGVGGQIGYSTGSQLRVMEDMQILKPTFVPSVPKMLNKIYQTVMAAGNVPGLKGNIFRMAVESKLHRLRTTGVCTHAFWDRLVFRKVQAALGGNVVFLCSGSAPLNREVWEFLCIAFGCQLPQESCGTSLRTLPYDPVSKDIIGFPHAVNEVKLVDVPSLGYTVDDKPYPRGEIVVRGSNCFSHYYKDPEKTKETIDEDRWLHTGDVATVDEHGRFQIIDRVKNIMKLAQGEYVALEKVELVFSSCTIVSQICLYGDSLQSYMIGVVVPEPLQLAHMLSKLYGKSISAEDDETLAEAVQDPRVNKMVLDQLTKHGVQHGLNGFEIVKRIHITMEQFSVEEGTLTPTLKLRRKDAHKKYKEVLDALYALGEPTPFNVKL